MIKSLFFRGFLFSIFISRDESESSLEKDNTIKVHSIFHYTQ